MFTLVGIIQNNAWGRNVQENIAQIPDISNLIELLFSLNMRFTGTGTELGFEDIHGVPDLQYWIKSNSIFVRYIFNALLIKLKGQNKP